MAKLLLSRNPNTPLAHPSPVRWFLLLSSHHRVSRLHTALTSLNFIVARARQTALKIHGGEMWKTNGQVSEKENQLLQILWRYTPRATLFRRQLISSAVRMAHILELHSSRCPSRKSASRSVRRAMCRLDVRTTPGPGGGNVGEAPDRLQGGDLHPALDTTLG